MNKAQEILKLLEDQFDEYIKKEGSEYCVYSHQTNKNFGCYKTKGEAEKRLQQMFRFRDK